MANEFVIKNGYFSQRNSNVTGSLRVSGSIGVVGSGSDVLSVYGSQGNLLVVNDTFSGSIFTVTDISGYPILDITSDYYTSHIEMIGTASLTGSLSITQDLAVGQNLTASKALFSSSNGDQLTVIGSGSTIAQVYGSQGNLLTVNDTFSGSIFTVTDISGYPILDITSNYYTGSVFLPTLTTESQQYVITYNSESGQLFYSSPSSVAGGAGGPNLSVQFNSASLLTGSSTIYINNDGITGIEYDHLRLDNAWLTIRDSSDNILFTIDGLQLGDTDGKTSIDWASRKLYDALGTQSIGYDLRQLTYQNDLSFPAPAVDWSTFEQILISGSVIPAGPYVDNTSSYNLGSPTAAWNEIYVSNNSLYLVSGSVSASIGFNNGAISFTSASLSLPTLTTASQQYIVTYNSESGQLFYTASSAIGGGGPSTFNSTSSIIGNGALTTWNINHGFNTRNLHITVYESGSNGETVYPDIRRINENTASIIFANPPSSLQYIVYISQ